MKHRHPVTKFVSIKNRDHEHVKQVIKRLKNLGRSHLLEGLNGKALRDEGRK